MKEVFQALRNANQSVGKIVEKALNECADDLIRTSSESAPHYKGVLEESSSKDVVVQTSKATATVTYSVKESNSNGDFNYALKMHEDDYNLGEKSRAKQGGTGMSGKNYPVGKKYLTRPLYGEAETYKEHITKRLRDSITGGGGQS